MERISNNYIVKTEKSDAAIEKNVEIFENFSEI